MYGPGIMVHACNCNYSGGSWPKASLGKVILETLSEKQTKCKRTMVKNNNKNQKIK
jgi:hypothetical protein